MFTMAHDKPIHVWMRDLSALEEDCLAQAKNLAELPFTCRHVALMPDAHTGYGMPIGGVLATENVVIPNAVGVDIGCGMRFVETDISLERVASDPKYKREMIEKIYNVIPVGFAKHSKPQDSVLLRAAARVADFEFEDELENAAKQLGTLGGGNHFIELQGSVNGSGNLCIMLHSGSRHLGKAIADVFNKSAKNLNKLYYSEVKEAADLAFLPMDTQDGQRYWWHMELAQKYAEENRQIMMERVVEIIGGRVLYEFDCKHNYARKEIHFGKNVIVHRKGAISARAGELGIIPGAMGSYSYIVEGLGNKDSFMSCSHGAGRRMSRKKAKELYNDTDVLKALEDDNVFLANSRSGAAVADECKEAYKDIDKVMEDQVDLVKPIRKLKTLAVVKDTAKKGGYK